MFRKNKKHMQPALISNVTQLPERQRLRLEQSWAGVFYREVFSRLDETRFGVLYADIPSRPNVPVNVLVGLEYMKSGFGWSDEELYDAFLYNVQVRYALGYDELGEGEFDLRTMYYFRQRLNRHMQEKGENLLAKAFEQVTDEQLSAFRLKTGMQRMDTTQVASNIREWGRLEFLVVVLQRVYRMLTEGEQSQYADAFHPYVKDHAGHYMYNLKEGDFKPHLQRIGDFMFGLLSELKESYAEDPTYQMLERVFHEHYQVAGQTVTGIAGKELNPKRLLSPDDFGATLRGRRNTIYQGYVANISETCDPENEFQLITQIQLDSNNVDDPQFLLATLPNLKERGGLDTLYTDGGFGSNAVDRAMQAQQVAHIPTAIRGPEPNTERLRLVDFDIQLDGANQPVKMQCPRGQSVAVERGNQKKGFVARFDPAICAQCPFGQSQQCPATPVRKNPIRHFYFSQNELWVALRRKLVHALTQSDRNLRAAIEATCRAVKCRYPKGKFPVRGRFRMLYLLIGSAAMNNIRRIQRFLVRKSLPENENDGQINPDLSVFHSVLYPFSALFFDLRPRLPLIS
jgi:hypothetical protein